jgi:phosphoglycolate phosphatase
VPRDDILFDLDGVIVASPVPFARCVNDALKCHGFRRQPEHDLHKYLGPPLHATFERLTGSCEIARSCVDVYREPYREIVPTSTRVHAGMRSVLEDMATERRLAVVTSKAAALAGALLESLGLRHLFAAVIGPDLATENEPKEATLGRSFVELVRPRPPVMVGDRRFDFMAAYAHGLPAIGVLWGVGDGHELQAAGADILVSNTRELRTVLRSDLLRHPEVVEVDRP